MNQQQVKYTLKRLSEIRHKKINDLRTNHTTEAVYLSNEEKARLLKEGKVTLWKTKISNVPLNSHEKIYNWTDTVVFPKEVKKSFDRNAFDEESSKVHQEYNKIVDELVLGNSEQALEMIKGFENS